MTSVALARADGPVRVYWDLSHGWKFGYKPQRGEFTRFIRGLESRGFSFDPDEEGVLGPRLASSDLLVLSAGTIKRGPYSPAEVDAIRKYVDDCHGLLVFMDNDSGAGKENDWFTTVTREYGIRTDHRGVLNGMNDLDFPAPTPVSDGARRIQIEAGGALQVTGDAVAEAIVDRNRVYLASAAKGRVKVVSDCNLIDERYMGGDNERFATNIFQAIASAVAECRKEKGTPPVIGGE